MNGQWIGECTGTNTGRVILNIDEFRSHYAGVGVLLDTNLLLPGSAISFRTQNKEKDFRFRSKVSPIHPETSWVCNWEEIKQLYNSSVKMPSHADVIGSWSKESISFSWTTDIGTEGKCFLPKSKADEPSELVPKQMDWNSFKEYVSSLEERKFLFRGQSEQWRLRTSFHRTGRADFVRFLNEDIQTLHRHLSARTKHVFNLSNPVENGAFFNLVQHHGYPTPLLDWTYSPYVAAFFAYRRISNTMSHNAASSDKVRIHVFDQSKWRIAVNQVMMVLTSMPHLSIGEFIAVENERMIPQQAASTVTNVDDIETYIKSHESSQRQFLFAIDLPVKERKTVMRELSYMGITAGSLFPGLDGACEELKERNFEL